MAYINSLINMVQMLMAIHQSINQILEQILEIRIHLAPKDSLHGIFIILKFKIGLRC